MLMEGMAHGQLSYSVGDVLEVNNFANFLLHLLMKASLKHRNRKTAILRAGRSPSGHKCKWPRVKMESAEGVRWKGAKEVSLS